MTAADAQEAPAPDRLPGAPHPAETARLHGQGRAERTFLSVCGQGRLHHAWMLRGPQGIGKATLAYRIARAVITEGGAPAALDRPEDCPVGRRIRAGSEPRLRVLRRTPDEKTGKLRTRIVIDDVRGLKKSLAYSMPDGGWRAVIVDAADEMTREAANALLKTLEEPPPRTLILLVAHAPGGLLPTIRSRCRMLGLDPLGAADLAAALAGAGAEIEPAEAPVLAELAGGSVGRALGLLEADGLARYGEIVALLSGGRVDRAGLAALADLAAGRGRETVFPLLTDLALILLARLARAGALGPPAVEAAPGEAQLMARVADTPRQARFWAEAASRLAAVARHARAVNLDPGQAILDIFLELDETLGRAAGAR
jgi:DNA polymerase-3 subunit delta'